MKMRKKEINLCYYGSPAYRLQEIEGKHYDLAELVLSKPQLLMVVTCVNSILTHYPFEMTTLTRKERSSGDFYRSGRGK